MSEGESWDENRKFVLEAIDGLKTENNHLWERADMLSKEISALRVNLARYAAAGALIGTIVIGLIQVAFRGLTN